MTRALVLLAVLAAVVAARCTPLGELLSAESLRARQAEMAALVAARPWLAAAAYVAAYVAVAALSLPGAAPMTLLGGVLFGPVLGTALAATGATAGATLVFLLARRVAGPGGLPPRVAAWARPLRDEGFTVLLALRLVPLVPFVLLNLVAGLAGMRLRSFVAATAIGVVPGGFVYASAGAGLGAALEGGRILTPGLLVALGAVAALALLTIPLRRWLARRGESG